MKKRLLSLLLCAVCALAAHSEVSYILNEGFESGIPATWTQQVMSVNAQNWVAENADLTYPNGAYEGTGRVAMRNTTGTTMDYVTRLITPVMNLPYGSQYELKFAYASATNAGDVDSLTVYYSTDGAKWQKHTGFGAAQNQWKEVTLDLIGNGATYQVAFEAYDKQGRGVVLDAVRVLAKSDCENIQNFAADAHANSVDLSWTGDFGATFQLIVDTVNHEFSELDPAGQYLHFEATTNDMVTVSGLLSEHTYYAFVRSLCADNESGYTEWQTVEFTTAIGFPYYVDFATAIPAGWQNLVGEVDAAFAGTLPTVNTSTAKWRYTTNTTVLGSSHVYSDATYTGNYPANWLVTPAIDIASVDAATPIELTFRLSISSSSSSASDLTSSSQAGSVLHVIISTDGGQSWTEANDHVFLGTEYLSAPRRVRVNLNEYKGAASSVMVAFVMKTNTSSAYFHIDDVRIDTYDAQCGDAANLKVSASDIAATATWTVNGKPDVVLQLSTVKSFSTLLANDTLTAQQKVFTALTSNTTYYVRVKQLCDEAEWITTEFTTAQGLPFAPTTSATWTKLAGSSEQFFGDSCTTTTSGWTTSTNVFPNHYKANLDNTNKYWLISPAVYLNPEGIEHALMSVDIAMTKYNQTAQYNPSSDDRFWIVISEDGGETWTRQNATLWSADMNDNPDYNINAVSYTGETVEMNMDAYIGKTIKVAFGIESLIDETNVDNDFHVANLTIAGYDPNCLGIKTLTVEAEDTEAVVRWTVGGELSTLIHVSTKSTYKDTLYYGVVDGVDSLLLTGLTPATVYYVRAFQNCGNYSATEGALKLNFKTHCSGVEAIPYVLGFESETTSKDPNCWTVVKESSTSPIAYKSATYAHGGQFSLYYGTKEAQSFSDAALPELAEPINTLEMTFWLRAINAACTNTLEVGVMTNPNDPSTFVRMASFKPTSTTYEMQTVSFNTYQGNGKYITFRNPATGKYGFAIDDIDVHFLPSCHPMGEVTVATVSSDGATLNFIATNATEYQVVVAKQSIDPNDLAAAGNKVVLCDTVDGAMGQIVISNDAAINGNTTYYVYVRGLCSENEAGAWSKEATFKTGCKPSTPLAYGVETFSDASVMDCWSVGFTTPGSSTTSAKAQLSNVTGFGKVLQLTKESVNTATTTYNDGAYAITPEFAVGDSINKFQISFSAATNSTAKTNQAKIIVAVVTSPSDLSTREDVQTLTLPYATDSTQLKEFSVSLANYIGDYNDEMGHYIMFQSYAGDTLTNYVIIDNVHIEPISTCPKVNEITLSEIATTTAHAEWDNTGAAQYEVLVSDVYTKQIDTISAPLYHQVVSTNSADVDGLTPYSLYYIYVRGICAEGDSALWSGAQSFKTAVGVPYLEPFTTFTEGYPTNGWAGYRGGNFIGDTVAVAGLTENSTISNGWYLTSAPTTAGMADLGARVEIYSTGYNALLTSPQIMLNALEDETTGYQVSFRVARLPWSSSSSSIGNATDHFFKVMVSEDGANFHTAASWEVGKGDFNYNDITMSGLKGKVDLTAYAGKSIVLGFMTGTENSYSPDTYFWLDSISVYEYNTDCAGAARLAVTADGLSAHATWNINGAPDETVFQLSTAADFTTLLMSDTLTGVHEMDLSDLLYNTTYYVRVKQNCSGSDWVVTNFETPLALPFVEDFEAEPQPWTIYRGNLFTGANGSGLSWTITSTEAGHSAAGFTSAHITNNSYLYEYFDYDYYTTDIYLYRTTLVSPAVIINNTPGNSVLLSFKAAVTTSSTGSTAVSSTNGHYLHLGLSTDDGVTWTVLPGNLYDTLTNRVQDFEYDLTQYDGQTLRFALYHGVDSTAADGAYAYLHLDDIRLESVNMGCLTPKGLTAATEEAHSVAFSWTGDATNDYVVELSANRGFASVLASDTVQATSYVFADLNASSTYFVRVKLLCGADDESGWSSSLAIHTTCDVVTLPFAENFNTLTAGIPNCWDNSEGTTTSADYKWTYYASGVTGACLRFNSYTNSNTNTNVLATPELYINKAAVLRFDVKNPTGGAFSVQIGRHGQTTRTTVVPSIITSNWETKEIDLLPYLGDTITIYFKSVSNYGTGDAYHYLDNVEIEVLSETKTVLEVHPTHIERTDFGVEWTLRDEEVCSHFEVVVATSTLDSAALAAAPKAIVEGATSYEAHLMQRGVTYYVYVRSVCDGENGDWMFTTLKTHTLDEEHVIGTGTASANLVYTSWGNTVSQMILTADELAASGLVAGEITGVSFNYTGTSSTYQKKQTVLLGTTTKTVYADYTDADFVVTGQSEYYGPELRSYQAGWVNYELATPYVWDGQSNIVLTVVTSQPDGLTHSSSSGWTTAGTLLTENRFIYRYKDNAAFDLGSISSASNGGCVATRPNVRFAQAIEACPTVEHISHARVGDGMTEARISWEAAAGDFANTYDLIYADSLITDWATAVPQFDSIARLDTVITGLSAYTDYYVYVRVNCDAQGMQDGRSGWSEPYRFKTASACPVIDNFVLVQTGKNEAIAAWTADFADHNFAYVLADSVMTDADLEAATPVLTTDTVITFSNLNYETTYHLYVAHNCGAGELSPYLSAEVTTSPFCQAVENLHVVSIAANTVQLAWTPAPFADATEWEVSIDGIAHVDHVSDPQVLVIGLEPETDYIVTVKAICGEGQFAEATLDFSTIVAAGDGTVVGNGTSSDYTAPYNNFYKNAWTQMIYPASQINSAGEIASIAYHVSAADALTETSLDIYMGHTSMPYAQSTNDWVPQGELTLVASLPGYVHNTAVGEWEEILLDTPFDYNGQDNLVIVTSVSRANYSMNLKYNYTAGTSGVTLYRRDDYDPTYAQYPTGSGTQSTYLPNVRLGFVSGDCAAAKSIKASVTSDKAVVTWLPGGAETAWVVLNSATALDDAALAAAQPDTLRYTMSTKFKGLTADTDYHFYIRSLCSATEESDWKEFIYTTDPTCVAVDSLKAEHITHAAALLSWHTPNKAAGNFEVAVGKLGDFNLAADSTYTLYPVAADSLLVNGLESQTRYLFAVREICAAGDTSRWSAVASFKTECGPIKALPWSEDFENANMECWILDNGVTVPASTSYHLSGATAMQFNKTGETILAILPEFAQNLSELEITYNWRCEGTSNTTMGYLEAGYVTDPSDASTFVQLQNHPQHIYSYEEVDVTFPTTVPDGARIAFRYSGQTGNYWLFVDDINVHVAPDCRKPVAVQATAGLNDAQITWNGDADQYAIVIVSGTDTIINTTVSDTTYTLTGLRSSTTYNMTVLLKSLCGGGGESVEISVPLTFNTQCDQVTEFPWSEDFNGLTSGIPACWDNTLGTTTSEVNRFTLYTSAQTDSPCMRFNSYSNTNGSTNYLATPELVVDTVLDLSFRYKNPTGGAFSVLASTDNGQTFVTLLSGLQGQMDWTRKSVKLTQFVGETIRIYFYAVSNYGSGDAYVYVDDVMVNSFNARCQGVDSVKVANVSLTGADVTFTYAGGADDAYIEVAKDQLFTRMLLTDTVRAAASYHIVGLQPSTTYFVRVKQLCGEDESSAFSPSVSFTTGFGVRYAPVFASTSASTTEWKSATGTAEDVVSAGSDLYSLTGWSLIDANAKSINAVHFKANVYGSSSKKWLVSPSIDLSPNATDGILLDFDAALTKYSYNGGVERPAGNMDDDRMVVLVCVDDSVWTKVAEWNNLGTGDYVYAEIDTCATHYQLNLTEFAGKSSVRIAFYGESTQSGDDNDLHVGNIVLDRKDAVNYMGDICEGEDYDGVAEGNGFVVSAADYHVGDNYYSKTIGDSIYVLSLHVHAAAKYEYSATVCEGETYMDENFNLGTVSLQTNPEQKLKGRYQSVYGCDSTIVLHLTINPIQRVTEQRLLCAGSEFEWNGQTISTVGNYTFQTTAVTGCDSIITLAVRWDQATEEHRDTIIHEGESFMLTDGTIVTEAGVYYDVTVKESGCTHTIIWHVDIETAFDNAKKDDDLQKLIVDDQLVIIRNGVKYSAQGARIE